MNILFTGLSGVPYLKRAMDIRLLSFAKLFADLDHNVMILNRYSGEGGIEQCDMDIGKNVSVVEMFTKKTTSHLGSKLLYIASVITEPIKILRIHKKNKIHIIHAASGHFVDLVMYRLVCRVINAKLIYQLAEFRSSYRNESFYHRMNGIMLAKHGPKCGNGVICISKFLMDHAQQIGQSLKLIKVPPIANFNAIEKTLVNRSSLNDPFLLFCGNHVDSELVNIVIESYNNSLIRERAKLVLVLRGSKVEVDQFAKEHPGVQILQNLEYDTLIQMYHDAMGLFIPMRDNIRDLARFPNKICEYSAAKGIIVTTRYGEIPNYFEDKVNAIIADDFSIDSISKKLDWLNENCHHLDYMRRNVFETGKQHFDLCSYKNEMSVFLASVLR